MSVRFRNGLRKKSEQDKIGVIIDIKYAMMGNLEKSCKEALYQIEEKKYDAAFYKDGIKKIRKYVIAFYKKNCKVELAKEKLLINCSGDRNESATS